MPSSDYSFVSPTPSSCTYTPSASLPHTAYPPPSLLFSSNALPLNLKPSNNAFVNRLFFLTKRWFYYFFISFHFFTMNFPICILKIKEMWRIATNITKTTALIRRSTKWRYQITIIKIWKNSIIFKLFFFFCSSH